MSEPLFFSCDGGRRQGPLTFIQIAAMPAAPHRICLNLPLPVCKGAFREQRCGPARNAAPFTGSPVPSSAPSGALRAEHQRNARAHRPPPHRLPPSAPGPLAEAAGYGPPLLRGFACRPWRHQQSAAVPAPDCLARPTGACARPSLRRRPGPPLASLRPSGGSGGVSTRSFREFLGCYGWALQPALRAAANPRPALLR